MRELTVDFGRLLRRAKRTRNAIVHGGPIAPGTVAAVLTFVDSIAVDALDLVMRARMTGRNPGDVFAERTARFTRCLAELDAGVPPAQALFWEPTPDT